MRLGNEPLLLVSTRFAFTPEEKAPAALTTLESGFYDATAMLALPARYRKRLLWVNMLERYIQEIRRREKVIRIFPNMNSAERLVGAICGETHEEWSTGRRYLNMDEYFDWKTAQQEDKPTVEKQAAVAA